MRARYAFMHLQISVAAEAAACLGARWGAAEVTAAKLP